MARLGVITDGISRDLDHALAVMGEFGLTHAELQYVWDKEVGDFTADEEGRVERIVRARGMQVSCISRHNFAGLPVGDVRAGDGTYQQHMSALKRCIELAKRLGCPLVRIMSFRKEMILFGAQGAEDWVVSRNAWDKLVELFREPIALAEEEGITLVVETGNNAMVTSAYLGHKLIDDLGTDRLKVLWDPCNSLYCTEPAFPDGYEALSGGHLGHLHIKDAHINVARATVKHCPLGKGDMAPFLADIARQLREDGYDGAISLESNYRPEGGTYEDGFRASIERFKALFGDPAGRT